MPISIEDKLRGDIKEMSIELEQLKGIAVAAKVLCEEASIYEKVDGELCTYWQELEILLSDADY